MLKLFPSFDNERIIHSIKTALACLIGFMITQSIDFQIGQWLVITIIVVMCAQINVGSMIQKSYMRFLGTLTGSVLAALMLYFFGHGVVVTAVAISLFGILFSYIATSDKSYSDAGALGAVTVAIILMGQDPTPMLAFERFLEISVGILIAAVVSQFILPVHARMHLRRNQAKTLRQLRFYYLAIFSTDQSTDKREAYLDLDNAIAKSLIAQRKLASESTREPLGEKFNVEFFGQSLWCERESLRCISLMYVAYRAITEREKIFSDTPALQIFHDSVCQTFDSIARCIEQQKREKLILPLFEPLKNTLQKASQGASEDNIIYLNGFLFCAETLIKQLEVLIALVAYPA